MANRPISRFPFIDGSQIDELDLLTLVHVFEVDPTLRNKKITFAEFRNYLDQYYLNLSGDVVLGSLSITGNLEVYGDTYLKNLTASGLSSFSGVIVQNNLTASGAISGSTITGQNASFSNITGISGVFTSQLSGATVTGNTVQATTGVFGALVTSNLVLQDDLTVSGDLFVFGSGFFASGVNVTGTLNATTVTGVDAQFTSITGQQVQSVSGIFTDLSGATVTGISGHFISLSGSSITGEAANLTTITGSTLHITTPSGATPAIVCSGVVSGDTGGFIIQGPLIILP